MASLSKWLKSALVWVQSAVLAICLPVAAAAEVSQQGNCDGAYTYLNQLRIAAGMNDFVRNGRLEASAADHARYLSLNTTAGHEQAAGSSGFTGKTPGERAAFRGYASRVVTENFSFGQKSPRESIDNLMGAIYHRFAFLDVSKNELGVGTAENSSGPFFVYNLGNAGLEDLCRNPAAAGEGPYLADVCSHGGRVSAERFEQLRREVGSRNPLLILWPHDNAEGVPTAFYEEIPDPLPDYRVSGYPVSAQLNPFRVGKAELRWFRLYHERDGHEVQPVRVITRRLDPQQRFSDLDFALFPLTRLDWDTPYRAEIVLAVDGKEMRRTWTFRTVSPTHPMFVIPGRGEILKLQSGRPYLVHLPVVQHLPYIERLRWESMSGLKTEVVWQDRNTLRVRLSGDLCASARFMLNGDRSFTLQIAEVDNLNSEQQYSRGSVTSCAVNTIRELPGFKIAAKGEVIPMKSDQDYWVEVSGTTGPVTEVHWQLMSGMTVRVSQLHGNLLKIRVVGQPGQIATFFLSSVHLFKIVLIR